MSGRACLLERSGRGYPIGLTLRLVAVVLLLPLGVATDAQPPSTVPEPVAPAMSAVLAPPPAGQLVLQAGTEVPMKTLRELSSKHSRQGDRFDLVVSEDVLVDGYVVIPKGSRGIGEITRLEPKGAFGKSGKLETRLLYVAVGKTRIRLDGQSADRGKSGTGATVATAVFAGVAAAFVTGTSATIPSGSTMIGYTDRDLPILLRPVSPPAQNTEQITVPIAIQAEAGGT